MNATKEEQLIDALCYRVGIKDPDKLHARIIELVGIAIDGYEVTENGLTDDPIVKRLAKWCGEVK